MRSFCEVAGLQLFPWLISIKDKLAKKVRASIQNFS